ncbi:MAG TPA: glucoamylase family protein, partial [Bryobacteraceae bacterium]|nr:glucoamylase family protein [Bryobacteraceae bacterium]
MMKTPTLVLVSWLAASGQPTSSYYRHTIFDNSLTHDRHWYSGGYVSEPSTLQTVEKKLPVDREVFLTPPNSIRIERKGSPGGSWEAELHLDRFRNRPLLEGDTLRFWVFAKEETPEDQLPEIELRDQQYGFTAPVPMSRFVKAIPAGQWTEIRVPLRAFETRSLRPFMPSRLERISLLQTGGDGKQRTWWIDEVQIMSGEEPQRATDLPAPSEVKAAGYERHIDVTWKEPAESTAVRYIVHRSLDGAPFRPIGIQVAGFGRFTDYVGAGSHKATYKVTASGHDYKESGPSAEATASTRRMTDDELLTMLQEANFRYYWHGGHPAAGMALENIPGDDNVIALGASGFGIMAIIVGAERGFVTRAQALDRLLKITTFLEKADRYHGVWPHFLDGRSGKTMAVFGKYDSGADLVETSFLIQGLLVARQYFRNDGDAGKQLHDRITKLWRDVEWDTFRRSPDGEYLFWHWSPRYTWHINHRLIGFNEVMITYLLAFASPTHGVPASLYYTGWASKGKAAEEYRESWSGSAKGAGYANGNKYFGITLPVG